MQLHGWKSPDRPFLIAGEEGIRPKEARPPPPEIGFQFLINERERAFGVASGQTTHIWQVSLIGSGVITMEK
ncbi:MAG: hypothetical protein AUG51_26080 [Acidobacteria bacterium 13_1_20CM_3_53_8]|nr:MAG: hypothetical protein AUG51_26080 [Acidobacteria bacterium 13_1_20CM_3_53_8]